jgi:hypothetical protein
MKHLDRLRRRSEGLTAEFRLVLECVRWPREPARDASTREIAAAVSDWDRVAAIVKRQGVPGLVNHSLIAAGAPMPDDVARTLGARATASAADELVHVAETIGLVRALGSAKVGVTLLKGPATALAAYGRLGVRRSVDIDLLVTRDDMPAAAAVVESLGYRRVEPVPSATPAQVRGRLDRYKDFSYIHDGKNISVELHWRLFLNPRFVPWIDASASEPVLLPGGVEVRSLAGRNHALYLCAHGAEHAWSRLKWLADLGAILNGGAIRADELYSAASAWSGERIVGPGIVLSGILLGTDIPPTLAEDLDRDRRMRALCDIAFISLVGNEDGTKLEETASGSTRKNFSHYLFTSDPRYVWHEARYDLLDNSLGGHGLGERIARLFRFLLARG